MIRDRRRALTMAVALVVTLLTPSLVLAAAPDAVGDGYSVAEDDGLVVAAPGVLANDSDPEGDPLTAVKDSDPSNGDLALDADGGFSYTPDPDFFGSDSFTYHADDANSESSGTVTVTITVTAVNDPPSGDLDNATITVAEDAGAVVDSDRVTNISSGQGESQSVTFTATAGSPSLFSSGPSISSAGTLTFTPAANRSGTTSVSVSISDGQASVGLGSFTISITAVNDPPVADNDSYTTAEDTALHKPKNAGVLIGDTDAENDPLTAVQVTGPSHGTLSLSADGSFTYTPAANFNGPDSFTYSADDGQDSSTPATVSISVTAVNDPPVGTLDKTPMAVSEDSGQATDLGRVTGISPGPADESGQTISFDLTPGNPALFASGPAISAAGTLTFTPAANVNGSTSVAVEISDGSTSVGLGSFTITISGANDPPTGTLDTATMTVAEDSGPATDAGRVTGITPGPPDESGQTVSFTTTPVDPSLFASGPAISASGTLTFTPAANANGSTAVSVSISDGLTSVALGSFQITISAVNDLPTGVPDAYGAFEETTLVVDAPGVLGNDTDLEGSALTAILGASPTHGSLTLNADGSFSYTPAANFAGVDTFKYRARDAQNGSSPLTTVTITVANSNDPPQAVNDSGSTQEDVALVRSAGTGVLANDSDSDPGTTLSAQLVTPPASGALVLQADGGYTFTPPANGSGIFTFTYRASDGQALSNLATVTLTVNPVNDAPVAVNDSYNVTEDVTLTRPQRQQGVLANDTDVEGTTLGALLVSSPTHGQLTLSAVDGSFSYVPALNYNGPDSFTYRATDGALQSGVATVSLTVVAVNDIPLAGADSGTTAEDVLLSVAAPGLKSNDSDLETATTSLVASLLTQATHGTATVQANGAWSYQPQAEYNGTDTFTYRVSDGAGSSLPATVTVTITPVNDAPVGSADAYAPNEDQTLVVPAASGVLADDVDIDSAGMTATLVSGPTHGVLTLQATGGFTYRGAADYNGPDSFTYRASDGVLQSGVTQVALPVAVVNDPPTFTLGAGPSVLEDSGVVATYPGFLTAIDPGPADESGQTATIVSPLSVASPLLFSQQPVIDGAGTLTFKPATNRSGTSLVTVTVTDNGGVANGGDDSGAQTFIITVTGTNDPPTANSDSFGNEPDDDGPAIEAGILTPLDVFANDFTLPDVGETMTIKSATKPSHGTVTIAPGGTGLSYRSTVGYAGGDMFVYTLSDGVLTDTATVHLTIADTLSPSLAAPTFRFATGAKLTSTVKVILGWSASDPGSGVKSYDVQQSTNGGSTWANLFSATTGTTSTRSLGLSTTYSYRFRARDKGNRLSAWSAPVSFAPTRYQESTSLATYSGSWKAATIASASGDHTKYSKSRGALATFTFTGRAVSLVAPRSSSRGKADIRVDGVLVATVSLYRSSTDARHHVWSRSWSAVGPHVVTVTVRATSGHPRFDIDAWTVLK